MFSHSALALKKFLSVPHILRKLGKKRYCSTGSSKYSPIEKFRLQVSINDR
jgi:hypothetical protein